MPRTGISIATRHTSFRSGSGISLARIFRMNSSPDMPTYVRACRSNIRHACTGERNRTGWSGGEDVIHLVLGLQILAQDVAMAKGPFRATRPATRPCERSQGLLSQASRTNGSIRRHASLDIPSTPDSPTPASPDATMRPSSAPARATSRRTATPPRRGWRGTPGGTMGAL